MKRSLTISASIIKRYNNPGTVVVVSFYPNKAETYSTGKTGVASYTKNVVKNLNRRAIVLCDIETEPEYYSEKNILVIRCFRKDDPNMWLHIWRVLRQFPQVKSVLTQYDFAMYGNPFVSSLGLILMGLLRVRGYRTIVTLHHVVDDILKLSGHVGLTNSPRDQFIGKIYNLLFHNFYRVISIVATQVVVLEESLKQKLEAIAPWVQVTAIPHGVDTNLKQVNQTLAKRRLGIPSHEPVVLFFGYMNWFKGADIFARTFARTKKILGKRLHVVMAGGESPTLQSRSYYQKFYRDVRKVADQSPHIRLTGYVPQRDIATYFSAADLVVFPYRHYMTASGVLSLAFSYQKPFIISRPLAEMFRSRDFEKSLESAELKTSEITFDLYPQAIIDMTKAVLVNGRKKKLADMAITLRQSRSYSKIAKQYSAILLDQKLVLQGKPALEYR
jgi:glycosyltransferase involved in cell wall biosynthesis